MFLFLLLSSFFGAHTQKKGSQQETPTTIASWLSSLLSLVPMCFSSHVQLDLSFQAINGPSKVCPGIGVAGLWWWWIADVSVRQSMAKHGKAGATCYGPLWGGVSNADKPNP